MLPPAWPEVAVQIEHDDAVGPEVALELEALTGSGTGGEGVSATRGPTCWHAESTARDQPVPTWFPVRVSDLTGLAAVALGHHAGADHFAMRGARDDILGLEENIIIGHPIPVGSGIYRYAEIDFQPPAGYEAPPPRVEEPVSQPALTAAALIGEDE
jgi:hypothetical protein